MLYQDDNLLRDGTSQRKRYFPALNPESVTIEDRDLRYYLDYVAKFAKHVRYYDRNNTVAGDWTPFFPDEQSIDDYIINLPNRKDLPAHQALLIAFLKLLEIPRYELNNRSRDHIRYYYEKVLEFRRKQVMPDRVFLSFDLIPGSEDYIRIKKGTEFPAGKNENGTPVIFTLDEDSILNRASIKRISTVFTDIKNQHRVYVAPIANSIDGLGKPLNENNPFWNPFGEPQATLPPEKRTMLDAKVGFVITSPILFLEDGNRTVTVAITCQGFRLSAENMEYLKKEKGLNLQFLEAIKDKIFESGELLVAALNKFGIQDEITLNTILEETNNPLRNVSPRDLLYAFSAETSSENGWYDGAQVTTFKTGQNKLVFKVSLGQGNPAVTACSEEVHQQALPSTYPALRLTLNHKTPFFLYNQLRSLKVIECSVKVDVRDLRKVIVANSNGPLNSSQAFFPFGATPSKGASFYFGSQEVFNKKLDYLGIKLAWGDLPNDFTTHYVNYVQRPANFTAQFSVQGNNGWIVLPNSQDLFLKSNNSLIKEEFQLSLPIPALERNTAIEPVEEFSPALSRGFGRLTLTGDFGHSVYPASLIEGAKQTSPKPVNPPYTPKITSFSVYYSSTVSFDPNSVANNNIDRLMQVEPLGTVTDAGEGGGFLLPQLPRASLLIGLSDLAPPSSLSFLFRILEANNPAERDHSNDDVQWSYLTRFGWKKLDSASILSDSTEGLRTTGIVEIYIDSDATDQSSRLEKKMYWIRAARENLPEKVGKVASVLNNAATATLMPSNGVVYSLTSPLPPDTLSRIINPPEGIKAVKQPLPSFGGRTLESDSDFLRRVSERLRHRNRAVTIWDYEHLVLEAFPAVYKVKCLQHTSRTAGPNPGAVTLVVVPDLRQRNTDNLLQPAASPTLRNEIRDFILKISPSFINVFVDNPRYEPVLLEMTVGLKPGYDGGYYGKLLNDTLRRFLSPWAFEEGQDIIFGGTIYKSSILAFAEKLEYVDFITDFRMFHLNHGPAIGEMVIRQDGSVQMTRNDFFVRPDTTGKEEDVAATASSPRSILVSAEKHRISILNPGYRPNNAQPKGGIGAMIIEVDFIVKP